jgi:hypothetical protein
MTLFNLNLNNNGFRQIARTQEDKYLLRIFGS